MEYIIILICLFYSPIIFLYTPCKEGIIMINEVVLLGKLANEPTLKETNNGAKIAIAVLEIEKGFKNGIGVIESDYVSVILWRGIAEALIDCSKKGSIIGIKGRLQSRTFETSEKQRITTMEVVAEKVSFLDKYIDGNKT